MEADDVANFAPFRPTTMAIFLWFDLMVNVSGFKYSKKNLSGQNSSSETDVFVSCHLHYHICQRLSPGLLSKLQEGVYEPGRHIPRGGVAIRIL